MPAGKTAGNAGHHHLLIDRELPLNFKEPLPFTEHYIHFGKGQMEALVDRPPGSYTLRLVLADQGHIPYFVFSKPLHITVTKQNKGVAPETVLGKPRVELIGLADGATVRSPFRAQFHASGYNVSATATKASGTGHFRLTLKRGSQQEAIDFASGQTETWLSPPTGNYSARVEFMSNNAPGQARCWRSRRRSTSPSTERIAAPAANAALAPSTLAPFSRVASKPLVMMIGLACKIPYSFGVRKLIPALMMAAQPVWGDDAVWSRMHNRPVSPVHCAKGIN